ncbi:hypothetical protein LCGC14_2718520, partial [marine sediment metagenome]
YSGEQWSCCIVEYVERQGFDSLKSSLAQRYQKVFFPEGDSFDFAHEVGKTPATNGERDNLRVLMLCLMAVCWRDFQ